MMDEQEINDNKICCFNCKYFEDRTQFCRLNPPVPMNVNIGGIQVVSSNFPKINIPTLDWCAQFEKIQ